MRIITLSYNRLVIAIAPRTLAHGAIEAALKPGSIAEITFKSGCVCNACNHAQKSCANDQFSLHAYFWFASPTLELFCTGLETGTSALGADAA